MSNCPECAASVQLTANVRVGEVIRCPDCQAQLEIISRTPIILSLAPEVEEDWGE